MTPPPRRCLVAQHRLPEFDRERGSLRVLEIIEHLLADGWLVTYLTLQPPSEPRYVRHLARLGVRTLVGTAGEVRDELATLAPDLAVVAFWHVATDLVPVLREVTPATRIAVDSVDLHFVREARRRADRAMTGQPWIDDAAAWDYQRELNAYAAADAVLTVSEDEALLLRSLSGGQLPVHTVPLAEKVARSAVPLEDRRGITFVGNFRHLPNIEAVAYLCGEVLPRLDPELLADHPVSIVGNGLDERVVAAVGGFPGVRLVGWVPDLTPYLDRARVAVAPLLHGAGVKGKVLQALMAGTPMALTSVALEGTSLRHGEHVLAGDDAASLARAVATLLTDDEQWQHLADAGWREVASAHGVEIARARFRSVVGDIMSRPRLRDADEDSRRWIRRYEQVQADVARTVAASVPEGSVVAVVSGGDDELVALAGRSGVHFPADADGWHSFHPVDGAAAVTMLDGFRARGGTHLVMPSTAYYWLHQYPELNVHLRDDWHLVAEGDELRIWAAAGTGSRTSHDAPELLVVARAAHSNMRRVTCVDALPSDGLERYHRIVVAPGQRLDAAWLDRFIDVADRLGLDVAQAPAAIGTRALVPAAEQHEGIVARRTRGVATTPAVALRPACAGVLHSGRLPADARVGIIDACPLPVGGGGSAVALAAVDPVDVGSLLDISTDGFRWQGMLRPTGAPRLSVVVATYERAALLEQCLGSLFDQTLPHEQWEVVVVDDGSTDATPEVMRRWAGVLPVRWMRISHAGRSAAKNLGIMAAAGEVVLLLDDDDVAGVDLLLEHVKAHDDEPDPTVAVLGYTTWASGVTVTPLMDFVTTGVTMLFAYHELNDGDRRSWQYFWEGRLSCKRRLLLEHALHDQRLAYTIDIELGYRLAHGPGLTVVHRRSAESYMARAFGYDEFLTRMTGKGTAQHRFAALHPEPEVRDYCFVETASRVWGEAAPTFERDRQRIGELEALVADEPDLLGELHQLYARTLRGANRRAILEAAAEDAAREPARPTLSVVMPVWSVTPELADMAMRTVERLWDVAQLTFEVVVVDNASPHRRPMRATTWVEHSENRGVAAGWNAGIAASTAPTIAVLNSDVMVEPGWDTALVAAADDGRRIAFPYTDHGDGLGPRRADQAGTAGWCFVLKRALFEELGPFDEAFTPAFFEDADYWTRAYRSGVELSPVPGAVVRHVRRTSARHHADMDALFQAHRMKYSWKHGVDPTAPPPYWHRPLVEYLGPAEASR